MSVWLTSPLYSNLRNPGQLFLRDYVKSGSSKSLEGTQFVETAFQKSLVEVGVFGVEEFAKRVPNLTRNDDYNNSGYPVVRYISHRSDSLRMEESLIFQSEKGTIEIHRTDGGFRIDQDVRHKIEYWEIERPDFAHPVPGFPSLRSLDAAKLILHPEIYDQIVDIANVDKVANAVLRNFLPQGVTNIALEYAGYPQKSLERIQDVHQLLFESFREYPESRESAYLLHKHIVYICEGFASTIADYVGEDDRVENASDVSSAAT